MIRQIYIIIFFCIAGFLVGCETTKNENNDMPNIVIVMADDLGYGDLQCYGNKTIKTPNLDLMAEQGVLFNRFYAAAPVCSPTRGSCLTGRHPYRLGIPWAGRGHLPAQEITIAEALKTKGYATGHFGKWHVGTLSKTIKQSYFPGEVDPESYSPPWENGFDECYSTESMMPTYNPYYHVGGDFGTEDYKHIQSVAVEKGQRTEGFRWRDYYWTGPGQIADEWLEGDDSKIIMDQALNFIGRKAESKKSFFSVIWFHTPHTPVVAGNEHRAMYSDQDVQGQHWFGAITAMDEQVGRLREELRRMGVAENTMIWFCSDNGPSYIHNYNSAGGLRGKKAELYEGGVRVPAILEWPAKISGKKVSSLPLSTSDFYPTILAQCGVEMQNQPILDGADVMDKIISGNSKREKPILFQSPLPNRLKKSKTLEEEQFSVVDNNWKLISADNGRSYQLYDLDEDESEQNDIEAQHPEKVKEMQELLHTWRESCQKSLKGFDYK